MRKFTFTALAAVSAILLIPTPVEAGTLLPNLYAKAWCEAKDMGMSEDDAATYAVEASYISSGNPPYVTVNGQRVQTDVLQAVTATQERCPQHF